MTGASDDARPAKPVRPRDLQTPGLVYKPRRTMWLLTWSPQSDLVAKGYPKTQYRLWPRSGASLPPPPEPSRQEWEEIAAWCERYQAEMLLWANGEDPKPVFTGTISFLITFYQTDKDSPYRKLRHAVQIDYAGRLRTLDRVLGTIATKQITFRDLRRWYGIFSESKDGRPTKATAKVMMKLLKQIFLFGKLALPKSSGCADVVEILRDMGEQRAFASGRKRRDEFLTYDQARLLCETARREGFPSIALAQAFMFELGLRQKDMIGEWVPRTEPGVSDVIAGPSKWLMGARWEEVDERFVWTHRLSKSVSRDGIMDSETGKTEKFDLLAFPLVRENLGRGLNRANFPASGPILIAENTGRPWSASRFRDRWRKIARKAGIPDSIQNRDSRAGAATEADLAGVPRERVKRFHGHSNEETTAIYQREGMALRSEIAKARADKRKP